MGLAVLIGGHVLPLAVAMKQSVATCARSLPREGGFNTEWLGYPPRLYCDHATGLYPTDLTLGPAFIGSWVIAAAFIVIGVALIRRPRQDSTSLVLRRP